MKKFLLSVFKASNFFHTKSSSGVQSMKVQAIQDTRIAELTPMERREIAFETFSQCKWIISDICSLTELFCHSLKIFEKHDSYSNEYLLELSMQRFGFFAEFSRFLIADPLADHSKQLDELALRYGQIKEYMKVLLMSLEFQRTLYYNETQIRDFLEILRKSLTQSFP